MQGSDYDGYRPLLYACKHDKMSIVEWLLKETKVNTNVHTQVWFYMKYTCDLKKINNAKAGFISGNSVQTT